MSVRTGTRLGGRYVLTDRLATGGMGEVWRGRDEVLGRVVAVKILRPELSGDDAFRKRFRAEARTAGGLSHPGIAQVYDYGEAITLAATPPSGHVAADDGDGNEVGGVAYLVMELLPGEPLSAMISASGGLDSDATLAMLAQAARALHAAHLRGVIHRDIKPANLMVSPDGAVKVTDFGIARPLDHEPLTATGQVMGTAHYLAPELARGEVASPLSDVYALGVVAYECLAGHRPFDGENQVAVATAHLSQPPPPLSTTIPINVRAVVGAAMAKDKTERIQSAAELAEAFDALRIRGTAQGTAAATAVTTALRALTAGAGVDGLVAAPAPVPAGPLPPPRSPGTGGTGGSRTSSDPMVPGTAALDLGPYGSGGRSRARGGGAPVPPAGAPGGGLPPHRPAGPATGAPDGGRRLPRIRPAVVAASAGAAVLLVAGVLAAMGVTRSADASPSTTPSPSLTTTSTTAPVVTPFGGTGSLRPTSHKPTRTTTRAATSSPATATGTGTATSTIVPTSVVPTTTPPTSTTPTDSGTVTEPPTTTDTTPPPPPPT